MCNTALITAPDRTRLDSTQLAVELSWVLRVITFTSRRAMWMWSLLELVHVQFFASLVSLNKFRISTTSWVSESDRAVWSREKLQPTSLMSLQNWVLSDVSLYVTASVVIFNVSAISWTAFLFASFNSLLHPTKKEVHVFARVSLSVCLSVSKITPKRVHEFGWNVACRQMSGHGRTD